MSTTQIGKTLREVVLISATVVSKPMNDPNLLSSFVKETRTKKRISTPEIERKTFGDIKDATVTKIENGNVEVKNIKVGTLEALARGLEVPATLLFELAIGVKRTDFELDDLIYKYARNLPLNRKRDLLKIAKVFFDPDFENENELVDLIEDGPPVMTIEELKTQRAEEKKRKK